MKGLQLNEVRDLLLADRRRLCCNLPYLKGIDWAAAVCRINRIDNQLARMGQEPIRRITLEYSPAEALSLADALECVAKAIRKGAAP